MNYSEIYNQWMTDPYFDDETKAELETIKGNEKEIEDRFYKNLEFGTGGLRGVLGAGTNRMNIYTVGLATQGLANYILSNVEEGKQPAVAIAYDSRRMSPEFAITSALVLCANDIKVYLFESLRPTPELSFAVRRLGCIAGIVITASHNPPEYNGYKVYWSDGAQVPFPMDEEIIGEVEKINSFSLIKHATMQDMLKTGLLKLIGKEIDDEYTALVKTQVINQKLIDESGKDLTIVYTPIHGTGNIPVRRVLAEVGFENVIVVPEQELPDSNFSTVSYPNPEDPKAFELAIKLATEKSADIIIGTDPDSDRLGVVVRDENGKYTAITGNMAGSLLCEYVLSQKLEKKTLPSNAAVVSTIVSTDLTKEIAKAYNIDYYEVLTGFKYICGKIREFEKDQSNTFVFGYEESYGYLAGDYTRDKDGVVAAMLICEAAAYYKTRGMTLLDGLDEIYKKYGYFKETLRTITLAGISGMESIKKIMTELRTEQPKAINGVNVTEFRDYLSSEIVANGKTSPTNLPVSDVLYYVLSDGSWFCVRPSGTEPKIKIYCGVKDISQIDAQQKSDALIAAIMEIIEAKK